MSMWMKTILYLVLQFVWCLVGRAEVTDCGSDYFLDNGYAVFDGRNTTYNHEIPVYCNEGHDIMGEHVIKCLSDGTWSKNTYCQIRDCGTGYDLENGLVDFGGRNTTYNSKIRVHCNTGYDVNGSNFIKCQADGTWSQDAYCEIKDCGSDYTLENGFVAFEEYNVTTFNQTIPVICNAGYDVVGPRFIRCLVSGTWSRDTFCQIKDCGRNYFIENGYADFSDKDTTYNEKITVFCDDGYDVKGNSFIKCLANGTWSNDTYCQTKNCGSEYNLENGYVDFYGRNTTYGQKIPVLCNEGYEVQGQSSIECLADGTWSTDTDCEGRDCGTGYVLENGYVDFGDRDTTYSSTVPVSCDTGYALIGEPFITCLVNGTWGQTIYCELIDCGNNFTIPHGFVELHGKYTTYNSTLEVICDAGYEVHGDSEIKCLHHGSWSNGTSCQIKNCGSEYPVSNGYVKFSEGETVFNSTAPVICDIGFAVSGPDNITCLSNGSWSDDSICRIKDCGNKYELLNGDVNFTDQETTYNKTIPVKCHNGYKVHGDSEIVCRSSGNWSTNTSCRIKDCGNEFNLIHGKVNFTDKATTFNETIPVECDIGYKLGGKDHITCLPEGIWSRTVCNIHDCGANHTLDNGYFNFEGRNTTYNQTVPVLCNDGFKVSGKSSILCLSNGTWSNGTECIDATSTNIIIPIIAGVIIVVLVVSGGIILMLYWKWRRKGCFANEDEGPFFEHFDMEVQDWKEFRPGPVNLVDFSDYVTKMHENSNLLFADGFRRLEDESPIHPKTVAELENCRSQMRYNDILPFDHSRVKLMPVDDEEGSDFINASYIPGYTLRREYIVTQGPLPSTKDDFWRMIWEQKVDIAVMLTKCVERGRKKSEQYWPDKVQEPVYFGDLVITMRSESALSDHFIRVIEVTNGTKTQIVTHFQYLKWPDHGCPSSTWQLLNFITMIRQFRRPNTAGPMLVHCSAGVGRTGTYIAVDRLLQHIRDNDSIDVYSVLLDMRNYRCHMVQTEDQFIYVYECLRHFITKENDEGDAVSASPYPASAYQVNGFENSAFQRF